MIYEAFRDAGSPPGVFNSLHAAREDAAAVTESLIANEHIRKVEFIGSAAVGRIIGATAAKHLKPVLMELGGKCPSIVLDDADLQKAAVLSAKGALMHHGQICFGTERVIVHRSVADKFIELLVKVVESTPGGTAVSEGIAQHALDVLQDAKDKGAKFLYGGPEYASKNAVKPALVQIDPSASKDHLRIVDEETFGPSASVYIVDSDEEAIALANRSAYGLNATIHTKNLERAIKMGRELEYGQVHANSISVYTSRKSSARCCIHSILTMTQLRVLREASKEVDGEGRMLRGVSKSSMSRDISAGMENPVVDGVEADAPCHWAILYFLHNQFFARQYILHFRGYSHVRNCLRVISEEVQAQG